MKCQLSQLNHWLDTESGMRIVRRIHRHFSVLLPKLYGSHLLQVGIEEKGSWLEKSAIYHHYFSLPFKGRAGSATCNHLHDIPFATHSVDLLIVPFVLNLISEPELFLEEADRVVRAGGHVVFINIHPLGYWGRCGQFLNRAPEVLQAQKLFSAAAITKQLRHYGFETQLIQDFYHAPPFIKSKMAEEFFHQLGNLLPIPSTFYLLLALKKEMRLIKPQWTKSLYPLNGQIASKDF